MIPNFPNYGDCPAKAKLDALARLMRPCFHRSEFVDVRAAGGLVAAGLDAYKQCRGSPEWAAYPVLSALRGGDSRVSLVCAALFDLVCNAEYLRGRMANRNWIYCDRKGGEPPRAYYSFLKQCPKCCQDRGLEPRISGAQHKPSSHHIGEITTTAMALFVTLLGEAAARPLEVGIVSKQNHDVDMAAWRGDLLVLMETKASPLVSYPARVELSAPYTMSGSDGAEEIDQHALADIDHADKRISLYLANADSDIPLGRPTDAESWPYPPLRKFISAPEGLLKYLSAWGEVFLAYRVPKTERSPRQAALGYLANGWGDEIDSNKTKAGLGRTDDIKKGTYQLLKFGAHYRAESPALPIRGALVSNLDPLFLFPEYLGKLIGARWADESRFKPSGKLSGILQIPERDLFHLYDGVLTFNRPVLNDPLLKECFDFAALEAGIADGRLDKTLARWADADGQD